MPSLEGNLCRLVSPGPWASMRPLPKQVPSIMGTVQGSQHIPGLEVILETPSSKHFSNWLGRREAGRCHRAILS